MKKLIQFSLLGLALLLAGSSFAQDVKNINVSLEDKDGYKKITIKKELEDGTIDVINWEGKGEIPEDIKKEMSKGGNVFILKDGNKEVEVIGGEVKDRLKTKNVEVIVTRPDGEINDTEKEVKLRVLKEIERGMKFKEGNAVIQIIGDETDELILGENIRKNIVVITSSGDELTEVKVEVKVEEMDEEEELMKAEPVDELDLPKMERSLELQGFQMSPNPASDNVNLRFNSVRAPITIRAIDVQGRQIYREYIRDFDGYYDENLDLRDANGELLFISIEQEGKIYTDKLMIKRN